MTQKGIHKKYIAFLLLVLSTVYVQSQCVLPDVIPPIALAPADISIPNDLGVCGAEITAVNLGYPIYYDGCGVNSVISSGIPAGNIFPIGTTIVTWTITDYSGNSTVVTQNITIIDQEDPTITCSSNISIDATAGQCNTYVNIPTVAATDNCSVVSITNDFNSGGANASGTYPVGITTVTFTATDSSGNTNTCSIDITVNGPSPTITLNGNNTITIEACSTYTDEGATAEDLCAIPQDVSGDIVTTNNIVYNVPGTYTVTYTIGASYAERTIIVEDTTSPTLTLNGLSEYSIGVCSTYTELGANALDCTGNLSSNVVINSNVDTSAVGTYTVTYDVSDASGNAATQLTRTIHVVNIGPDITLIGDNPQIIEACNPYIELGATAMDNCFGIDYSSNLVIDASGVDTSTVGTYIVTYNASDNSGNDSIEVLRTVEVIPDTTLPTAICKDITLDLDNTGQVTILPSDIDNGSFDNCNFNLSLSQSNFDCSHIGANTITLTITDASGNSSSCQAQVTINGYNIADAGSDFINSVCTNTTITLAGNPVTAAGSTGLWTVTSGQSSGFSFSDATSPTSTFTGDIGETYTLTWSIDNPSTCPDSSDSMTVTFIGCNALDFDGIDDNISFRDSFDFIGNFTIEIWVKSETNNGNIQTIISKRESNNQINGYDLRLVNNYISFNWNNGQSLVSPYPINANKWHHTAITFDNGTYTLYIDGINVATTTGTLPTNNTLECIVGAMDQTLVAPFKPLNYFDGGMDELRIWNVALSETEIRKMMNQEIENNSNIVKGNFTLSNIGSLSWNNLLGYYRMNQISDISGGNLVSISGSPITGVLRYMTTFQSETAPIPYKTNANGDWSNSSTWLNGSVQNIPNSIGVDGSTFVDWNIVETSHNVSSGNSNITLLALDVASNTLSIENTNLMDGQSLRVSDYLSLDGVLDLVGESQLLMDTNSSVNYGASGTLQRDQQGTSNLFNYNYWSSPVSQNGLTFSVGNVLHDGSNILNPQPINWVNSYDATGSTNPISLSQSWIYSYENFPNDSYADWVYKGQSSPIYVGLGFTLKGSGVGNPVSDFQNYTFIGQPNNGLIELDINPNYQALVGNPYPSAIDANKFIIDNGPSGTNSIDGTLYFWEHSTTNSSHNLSEYEGGYATYNISGGLAAVTFPDEIGGLGDANKIPKQYIPVAQGFYVTASASAISGPGNDITFNNAQRFFAKESGSNSIFFEANDESSTRNSQTELISRVRLNIKSTDNSIRPLLLAFTADNTASDNIDYGYDAPNTDNFPNDAAFMIEEQKFVIQGVGAFKESRKYPIGLFLSNSGIVEFSLVDLENFDSAIDVYIYDAVLNSSTKINNTDFNTTLEANDYAYRYYIAFEPIESLSISEANQDNAIVSYLNDTEELYINITNALTLKQIQLFNILGQNVKTWNSTNTPSMSNEVRIPIKNISEGIYVVKIETSTSKIISEKIIIKYN